jgi:N6-L-threonylcarbamoyladenine synthase
VLAAADGDRARVGNVTRLMRANDLAAVLKMERASFTSPWTSEMLAAEIDAEFGWSTVATDDNGDVTGFLIGRRYPDMWHVLDLAVSVERRRQGVARGLVREFLHAADGAGLPVLLEVRENNAGAVALYESEGFVTLSLRRGYYMDTGENALVMVREAGGGVHRGRSDRGLAGPLLAIESSCDDTAAAVLAPDGQVLSSVSHSQDAVHERYGGVVPEAASRAHVERLSAVVSEALREADCRVDDLRGVAVTIGPGLIGALLVGVQTAKAIAWSRRLPLFPVNHLHGHLASAWLGDPQAPYPMITLVASGGHTMLVRVDDRATFRLLGQTLDDAAGEAFDKGARLLGLGYPGGKELDELAEGGDASRYSFPVGLKRSNRLDFSFSGVKTALYYLLRGMSAEERATDALHIAASYREAIVSALVTKTFRAVRLERAASVAIAGGVAANSLLRRRLAEEGKKTGVHVVLPRLAYCTDNAAMIGAAALVGPRLDYPEYMDIDASASLPLGRWLPEATLQSQADLSSGV